tara:strand:- start:24 stop:494 length:471 start_codon:yes stop_codon:yes gene_type:complete
MNEKKLLKYAVDYLSKYDSSKKNLLDILKRKIFRLQISGQEKHKLINILENIIIKLENNNLINDDRYSMSKISSLSRIGKSKNFIFNYLIKKGINKLQIQNNLEQFKMTQNDWELDSAKLFAKKKRLLNSNDSYDKKLAKMARAGFSYDICKKVLD